MNFRLHRQCYLEIDLDQVKHNFKELRRMAGDKVTLMPAIKANAYGHGLIMTCKALQEAGAGLVAVGTIDEAIALRKANVNLRIVIFASNLVVEDTDLYLKWNLIPTVMYEFQAQAISDLAERETPIFLKVECGRGRLGINAEEAPALAKKIAEMKNLRLDGIYTHMAYAGWDSSKKAYPDWQYSRFTKCLDKIKAMGIHIPFAQLCNTPGSIAYPDYRLTGICPGRGIWGYSPIEIRAGGPALSPVLKSWKSRLLIVKEVIGGKFGPNASAIRLDKPRRIGIACGGVADGISRAQANGGVVLVHGKRVPVCCPMSLEHTTVDLTDVPDAQPGDEVVIMGRQENEEITRDELVKLWDSPIPYFWTSIPEHVERVYYRGGDPVAIARGYEIEDLK